MRPELDHLRQLEHHLLGTPTAAETATWQQRLRLEPELRPELAAQQQLYVALREAGRQQLRRELTALHARLYPPRRRSWLQRAVAAARGRLGWFR